MRFRFWPNTLAVQLIVVTGVAVALSNIAVAFWFEYGNEQQSAIAANERVLDRAAAVATTSDGRAGFIASCGDEHHEHQGVEIPRADSGARDHPRHDAGRSDTGQASGRHAA